MVLRHVKRREEAGVGAVLHDQQRQHEAHDDDGKENADRHEHRLPERREPSDDTAVDSSVVEREQHLQDGQLDDEQRVREAALPGDERPYEHRGGCGEPVGLQQEDPPTFRCICFGHVDHFPVNWNLNARSVQINILQFCYENCN